MTAHRRPKTSPAAIGMLALSCLGAIVLAGCGGSARSASQSSSAAAVVPQNKAALVGTGPARPAHRTPALSSPDVGQASAQGQSNSASSGGASSARPGHNTNASRPDRVSKAGRTQRARHPIADNENTANPHASQPMHACLDARGAVVHRRNGLRGGRGTSGPNVHLQAVWALQDRDHARAGVKQRHPADQALGAPPAVTVSGHRAYCGHLGTQILLVPLPDGQMLSVSAPCAVARQFAAAAMNRLES